MSYLDRLLSCGLSVIEAEFVCSYMPESALAAFVEKCENSEKNDEFCPVQ